MPCDKGKYSVAMSHSVGYCAVPSRDNAILGQTLSTRRPADLQGVFLGS